MRIRIRKHVRRIPQILLRQYKGLLGKASYKIQPVLWSSLKKSSDCWTPNPSEIMTWLGLPTDADHSREFSEVLANIEKTAERLWPGNYDFGPASAEMLFRLVRRFKPQVVLETGVANGLSTSVILAAMDLNGSGVLHSIDTTRDVGHLFGKTHPRWNLHVTHGRPSDLSRVVKEIGSLDFFLHDSDHSYWGQMGEFRAVQKAITSGGLILSDDIDSSWAFRDFCSEQRKPFAVLREDSKLFGIANPLSAVSRSDKLSF